MIYMNAGLWAAYLIKIEDQIQFTHVVEKLVQNLKEKSSIKM